MKFFNTDPRQYPVITRSTRCLALLLALLCTASGGWSQASAYVLHGSHVLDLMTAELGQANQLTVKQSLFLYTGSAQNQPIQLNETVMYQFPDAFRSEINARTASRIQLTRRGRTLTVLDNQIINQHETELDRYKDILLYNSRSALEGKLPFWGIDVGVTSLGRFQGRLAYVIGAQYPDESVPQIWIDKHTLHPFRWIIRGRQPSDNGGGIEFRYLQWRQVDAVQYPMRIEFYQSDRLIREIRVQTVQVNPKLSEQLFRLDLLKRRYTTAVPAKTDPPRVDDTDDVQKTLQDFNKIFE